MDHIEPTAESHFAAASLEMPVSAWVYLELQGEEKCSWLLPSCICSAVKEGLHLYA